MAKQLPPFSHQLPWWDIRTIETGFGAADFMIMVDGSLALGYSVAGIDLYSFDDDELNALMGSLNRALNLLPEDGYLQADWRVGLDHEDIIGDFEKRGCVGNPVLREQRQRRAHMLRNDNLMRGRLIYYIGQRHAFGRFKASDHRVNNSGRLAKFLAGFGLGAAARDPYAISAEALVEAATALAEVAGRFVTQFKSAGITMTPLCDEQLLGEMHQMLNPASAKVLPAPKLIRRREQLHPTELEKTPYVFMKPFSIREQMPLGDLTWTDTTLSLDEPAVLHRVLTLQGFDGASSSLDSLHQAQFATSLPFRIVTTYRATDRGKMTAAFIQKQKKMNAVAFDGHVRNIQAEIAMGEYEDLIQLTNSTDQRLFQGSITAVLSAESLPTLEQATGAVKQIFAAAAGKPIMTTEVGRQMHAFLGALPGYGYSSPRHQPFLTSNATDFLPVFVPSTGESDAHLVYHTRQGGLRKVSFSPQKMNRNTIVLGKSGSGKSFNVSAMLEQLAISEGDPLIVVDVQGHENSNYRIMAELFGGAYTPLYGNGDLAFNPFPAYEDLVVEVIDQQGQRRRVPNSDKLAYLANLVSIMSVPKLSESNHSALQREIARQAILHAYDAAYKHHGPESPAGPPIISDVVEALRAYVPPADKAEYGPLAREMYLQLETWTRPGPRSRLLNRQTTYAATSPFQIFDFFGMDADAELATVLLMIVSDLIWTTVLKTPKDRTIYVVFDEVWKMLKHPVASELVKELYKTVRKHGGVAWAITQSAKDIMETPVAAGLRENAEYVFIHQVKDHQAVSEFCGLNERQTALVRNLEFAAGLHSEILLFESSLNKASVLRYRPATFEKWVNTTNAVHIDRRTKLMRERSWPLEQAIRFLADEDERVLVKQQ